VSLITTRTFGSRVSARVAPGSSSEAASIAVTCWVVPYQAHRRPTDVKCWLNHPNSLGCARSRELPSEVDGAVKPVGSSHTSALSSKFASKVEPGLRTGLSGWHTPDRSWPFCHGVAAHLSRSPTSAISMSEHFGVSSVSLVRLPAVLLPSQRGSALPQATPASASVRRVFGPASGISTRDATAASAAVGLQRRKEWQSGRSRRGLPHMRTDPGAGEAAARRCSSVTVKG